MQKPDIGTVGKFCEPRSGDVDSRPGNCRSSFQPPSSVNLFMLAVRVPLISSPFRGSSGRPFEHVSSAPGSGLAARARRRNVYLFFLPFALLSHNALSSARLSDAYDKVSFRFETNPTPMVRRMAVGNGF